MISLLFDSYYTTKPRGIGAGLFVCQTIILAHGGNIKTSSLSSGGACIEFYLPITN